MDDDLRAELVERLAALGYDADLPEAWRAWTGAENLEDRVRGVDRIDPVVLAELRKRGIATKSRAAHAHASGSRSSSRPRSARSPRAARSRSPTRATRSSAAGAIPVVNGRARCTVRYQKPGATGSSRTTWAATSTRHRPPRGSSSWSSAQNDLERERAAALLAGTSTSALSRSVVVAVLAVTLAAMTLAVRLPGAFNDPLWGDEVATARIVAADTPVSALRRRRARRGQSARVLRARLDDRAGRQRGRRRRRAGRASLREAVAPVVDPLRARDGGSASFSSRAAHAASGGGPRRPHGRAGLPVRRAREGAPRLLDADAHGGRVPVPAARAGRRETAAGAAGGAGRARRARLDDALLLHALRDDGDRLAPAPSARPRRRASRRSVAIAVGSIPLLVWTPCVHPPDARAALRARLDRTVLGRSASPFTPADLFVTPGAWGGAPRSRRASGSLRSCSQAAPSCGARASRDGWSRCSRSCRRSSAASIWLAGARVYDTRNLLVIGPFVAVAVAAAIAAIPRAPLAVAAGIAVACRDGRTPSTTSSGWAGRRTTESPTTAVELGWTPGSPLSSSGTTGAAIPVSVVASRTTQSSSPSHAAGTSRAAERSSSPRRTPAAAGFAGVQAADPRANARFRTTGRYRAANGGAEDLRVAVVQLDARAGARRALARGGTSSGRPGAQDPAGCQPGSRPEAAPARSRSAGTGPLRSARPRAARRTCPRRGHRPALAARPPARTPCGTARRRTGRVSSGDAVPRRTSPCVTAPMETSETSGCPSEDGTPIAIGFVPASGGPPSGEASRGGDVAVSHAASPPSARRRTQ